MYKSLEMSVLKWININLELSPLFVGVFSANMMDI